MQVILYMENIKAEIVIFSKFGLVNIKKLHRRNRDDIYQLVYHAM